MNKIIVYSMALLYFLAGVNHFYNPYFYLEITPEHYYNPEFLVAISGFVEILLAIMLLFKSMRKLSSWLIICMLVVFFFLIHVPMAYNYYQDKEPMLWLALLRLPVQALLVWWAYKVSKIKRLDTSLVRSKPE